MAAECAIDPGELATSPYELRASLLKDLGIEASFLGVGVDRVDYTKGIIERFRGIERFLEKYPAYTGKLTFVQIGAPSRTTIPRYHDLFDEVQVEAARINARFQQRQLAADRAAHPPSQPQGNPAVLPRGRFLHGHVAARRDESRRQGICRRAHGR